MTGSGESVLVIPRSAAVQSFIGELPLRGLGEARKKSAPFSFVSTHPPAFLKSAVVFDEPSMEEQDLLEYLAGARPCSRLACQLVLDANMETITVTVAQSDGL